MAYETDYSQHVLSNGLRVVLASRPWSRTFAASLAFQAGWRDESQTQAGITHLTEHLAFCGDNRAVVDTLGRQGLYINAQTDCERTTFQLSGHAGLLSEGLRIFSNVLCGIATDPQTLEREVEILGHELAFSAESPVDIEMRKLTARIIGDRNFGRPVLTTLKGLKNLRAEALQEYHRLWFTPGNAHLTLVSPATWQELLPLLEQVLGSIPRRELQRPARHSDVVKLPPLLSVAAGGDYVLVLLLHHYQPATLHPVHSVVMLSDLLGGGPYSILFRTIREQARMAYSVGSDLAFMSDCAILNTYAIVPRRQTLLALETMQGSLERLRSGELEAHTFEEARARLIRSLDLYEDNPLELCSFLSYAPQQGSGLLTPQHYREQLANFTLADAKAIVAEVLKPQRRVAVLMGPVGWLMRWRAKRRLLAGSG